MDDTNIAIGNEDELFSMERHKKLKKLEYIDIFLLEGMDFITDLEEIATTLEYIVHTGKAKHIGIANLKHRARNRFTFC
jgi:aryl-alcohol dehydrogenase-like predicted oxidoreductase